MGETIGDDIVIQYHPDGFSPGPMGVMGRQAAGAGFLGGFVSHSGRDRFTAAVAAPSHGQEFGARVRAIRAQAAAGWLLPHQMLGPGVLQTLALAGPDLAEAARARGPRSDAYSLCGVTHTTATHRVMQGICDMFVAPVQPWDALICTSRAVKAMVEGLLDAQADYLRRRLGACAAPRPQLPVIPLGVDAGAFAQLAGDREAARAALGIAPAERVILFVGRLSFHAKANPLPMHMALQAAAERTGAAVRLLLAGWYANDGQKDAFEGQASGFAPSISVQCVDGRDPAALRQAWAAADIFTLLADNIQETFGLAPIEAMAAGLPVVVSDWDGFRDTVEDGVQGMRIPTLQPPPGAGAALARRYQTGEDSYDAYVGAASQSVAVDVRRATDAFVALLEDEGLRRRMGEAGRSRAREMFDWSVVIQSYEALWAELGDRRRAARAAPAPDPARPDPFSAFSSYPTRILTPGVKLTPGAGRVALEDLLGRPGAVVRSELLPDPRQLVWIQRAVARAPHTVADLLTAFAADEQAAVLRSLGWMAKFDLLRIEDD